MMNVTRDINAKTNRENKRYEDVFKPKKPIITTTIIGICIFMFLLSLFVGGLNGLLDVDIVTLVRLGANNLLYLQDMQWFRLITYMFLHGSLTHIVVNMYSLYIIGSQIENYFGKVKYIIIFVLSGICGGLLSALLAGSEIVSVGASGAIFGLLGALGYFGYHYRLYLGDVLKTQIIPIVLINLAIGFMLPGIDNYCHIGGLIGGVFAAMAVGVNGKTKTRERISGSICIAILIAFLVFRIFSA